MTPTYLIAIGALALAVLVPVLLVPVADHSLVEGKIADLPSISGWGVAQGVAQPPSGGATATYHDVNVYYDVYSTKVRYLDPATSGDSVSAAIQANVFEPLYTYHYLKRPVELIPLVASRLPEMSADGLTCTIRIQNAIKYHRSPCFGTVLDADGKPAWDQDAPARGPKALGAPDGGKSPLYKTRDLTADDFVLAFKRIADYHICTEISYALIEDKIVGIREYRARTQEYDKGDFTRYDKEKIEGVSAPDALTLRIRLTKPFPQLAYVLATGGFAPIPHELFQRDAMQQQDARSDPVIHDYRDMVGTGPYYLQEFVDGGRIIFRRNPDFHPDFYPTQGEERVGSDGQIIEVDRQAGLLEDAGKRLPFIDVIYMDYVPQPDPMWMLFMTGQSDAAAIPPNVFSMIGLPWAAGPRHDEAATAAQAGAKSLAKSLSPVFGNKRTLGPPPRVRLLAYTGTSVWWMTFNMRDPVLGKSSPAGKSLRQAISLGYDVQREIEILHNGRGKRALNILPSGFEGHDQAISPYARYDKQAAREKLEQAKAELLAAGVIQAGDRLPPLKLSIGATNEQARRFAEFSKQQFADMGLEIVVELQDWPTLLQKIHTGQCQIYASYWQARIPDDQDFLQLFYSPNIARGANTSFYSNLQFDKLYEQSAIMPPSDQRTALYVRMLDTLNEDCPFALLSEPESFVLLQPWLTNVKPHPIAMGLTKYRRIDAAARKQAGGR